MNIEAYNRVRQRADRAPRAPLQPRRLQVHSRLKRDPGGDGPSVGSTGRALRGLSGLRARAPGAQVISHARRGSRVCVADDRLRHGPVRPGGLREGRAGAVRRRGQPRIQPVYQGPRKSQNVLPGHVPENTGEKHPRHPDRAAGDGEIRAGSGADLRPAPRSCEAS